MSPQWGGRAGGRSRRKGGMENVAVRSEEEKLTAPCFEGYYKGAWWEVDILEERMEMHFIRFIDLIGEDDAWYSLDNLRLRARKCDNWDCGILRRGLDVSVYGVHPQAEHVQPPTPMALYDAKIVSVTKSKHQLDCCCKFFVRFYSINEETLKKGVNRKLVTSVPHKEVNISRLTILQQPGFIPLHETIRAHINNKWVPEHRWSSDAYFLIETELEILRKSSGGEESMTTPRGEFLPEVSEEGLATPGGRLGTMNGQHVGKSKALKSPVMETNVLGTGWSAVSKKYHHREMKEVDHRGKNSTPMNNNKYPDRGVKRKHDSVEEKDISNIVQEDYSPEVGTSRGVRYKGMRDGGFRRQSQNVGHRVTTGGHETLHKAGGPVDPKQGRRSKVEEPESSPEENLPGSSEELIFDSGHNSERGSNRDLNLKRGRKEEEPVKTQRHHDYKTFRYNHQKASEQVSRGKTYGTKLDKFPDNYTTRKWQAEDAEPWKFSTRKVEKGSPAGMDPKVDKSEGENSGRRRGRPKKTTYEWVEKESPPDAKENVGRHTEFKKSGGPSPNFDSPNNVNGFGGSPEIETRREMSRRETRGKQSKLPEPKRSSERLLKVSSGKPLPKKKEPEKVPNDPGLAKVEVDLSSSSPNSEDPTSEQRRKLRPRTGPKSKKSQPGIQRDAEKDASAKEKVTTRPLYMDLLGDNSKNDDDSEKPCPTEQPKPEFGLKATWDPIVEDMSSDSDCNIVSEKVPPVTKVWQEFDTPTAVCTEQAKPVVLPAGAQQKGHGSDADLGESICEHKIFFKDDMGEVCGNCGLVVVPIEDVVPQVEIAQRRPQADVDEWDFDKNSPDINQGAVGYDQMKDGEAVTMLDACLPPHYAAQMHPHQKEGFEFLWRNLGCDAEGKIRNKKADKNAGCILSHAPGTGKSFLIIAFLKSYMDRFPSSRALIVAPKIMLLRWEKEFSRWKSDIRVFILNQAVQNGKRLLQKHEDLGLISLKSHQMNPKQTVDASRMAYLYEWKEKRSVCLVSYNLFSALTDEDANRTLEGETVRKSLLESPGILILDEGHFPRNKDTRIRKALMKVKTNARILLSGTLFQNNFEELFNTLYLVRPGFVEDFSSCELGLSSNMFGSEAVIQAAEKKARKQFVEEIGLKIEEGQRCQGSEVLQHGLQELQRLTTSFVHHHTGEVLACLPGLRDFGILLKPTTLQCSLLENVEKRFQRPEEYLKREIAVSETSIHPQLLNKLEFKGDILNSLGAGAQNDLSAILKAPSVPQDGIKTKFVFDLLRSLKSSSEKVLIFSQHISPLEMLEEMFKATFNWDKNRDVLRLDGTLVMNDREAIIERFNDPNNPAQVLLASTKACGEGINLVGASRVVFLDVLWNPAVIKQAISRAFRLGQKKTVYVYRLIAFATIEEKKYKKAIRKDWLSMSIFSPAAAGEADGQTDKGDGQTGTLLDPPERTGSKNQSPGEEILAWEVDASTCEDALLKKLLEDDKSQANSFLKVVEHGSQFHHRKTACGPDAREWFLDEWDYKDLSNTKEMREGEEGLGENTNPDMIASKLYQDYGADGAFDGGAASSSDTDEEIL